MKKFCKTLMTLLLTCALVWTSSTVKADDMELSVKAALLMVAETGQILYEKNSNQAMAPASITKVMTLYLTMEALEKEQIHKEDIVTVSKRAWEIGESSMFLNQGDRVSVDVLLQGLCVVSGNDAAIALAEHISGSVEDFVAKMNEKASALGMSTTHFQNPHGLDEDNHQMSASDIAILCRNLYNTYPGVIQYYTQESLTYGGIQQDNRNPLLGKVPGVDGIKTGFTDEAGYSIVTTAKKDNLRLIAVVLGCESEEIRKMEAATLLEYGFTHFQSTLAAQEGVVLGEVAVRRGQLDTVHYAAKVNYTLVIESGSQSDVMVTTVVIEHVEAPVSKGQEVGHLDITYRNQLQGQVPLVATEDIVRGNWLKILWQIVSEFFNKMIRFNS